jgi:hypothetical protein
MRLVCVACSAADGVWVLGDATIKRFDAAGAIVSRIELDRLASSIGVDGDTVWTGFDGEIACYSPSGERVGGFRDAPRLGRVTAVKCVDEFVLAGDATARCVRAYTRRGRWMRNLGVNNNTRGLLIPNGVVDFDVDRRTNTVVVANPGKHRVERYALNGELLGFWGRFGMHSTADFPGCCNPTNVAVACDGRVVVTEKAPPRLKVFSDAGQLLAVRNRDVFDPRAKNMSVAVSDSGQVYVADSAQLIVHVFESMPETVDANVGADEQPAAGAAP